MQIGQIIRIAMAHPKLFLKSRFYGTEQELGVNALQLTHEGVPFSNVKTVRKRIGGLGVAGCDANFATAANVTEQIFDLGSIIPALARVLDVKSHTPVAFNSKSIAIASWSVDTNVVTIVTSAVHGLVNSNSVVVAGMTRTQLNGTHTITVVNTTSFSFSLSHANTSSTADTTGTATPTVTLVAEAGNSSSGHEFIGSTTIKAAAAITCMAADHSMTVAPAAAASKVYVAVTPNVFWANLTSGYVDYIITYIETV